MSGPDENIDAVRALLARGPQTLWTLRTLQYLDEIEGRIVGFLYAIEAERHRAEAAEGAAAFYDEQAYTAQRSAERARQQADDDRREAEYRADEQRAAMRRATDDLERAQRWGDEHGTRRARERLREIEWRGW